MPYRSRSGKSRRNYGYERATEHINEGFAFSDEVGHADALVKDVFFSLSGRSRECLFKQYEDLYGTSAKDYAQQTVSSWLSGKVKMSGMVAKRLFNLMPPFMPTTQKHKIVEAIWKRYGPTSSKFVYIGPNSDADTVIAEIDSNLKNLNVLYKIPEKLEKQFDWLSDNDVTVKQQLLNYFMNEQRNLAMTSVRINLPMLLTKMRLDTEGKITKLSHVVFVGNHSLEIKADPRRIGFLVSTSPTDEVKPKAMIGWGGFVVLAIIVLIALSLLFQGSPSKTDVHPASVATSASEGLASLPAGAHVVEQPSQQQSQNTLPVSSVNSGSSVSTSEPTPDNTPVVLSTEPRREEIRGRSFFPATIVRGKSISTGERHS